MPDLGARFTGRVMQATHRWAARLSPTRLFERYRRQAIAAGIEGVHLVLSFDCDTSEDAAVVNRVHSRLTQKGIRPVYAVPGTTLRDDPDTYRELASAGGEFLNHGGMAHTARSDDGYESRTFYDQMTWDEVVQDVSQGHQDVLEVIGIAPLGFRTPHFGTFQDPNGLARLHLLLKSLGYRYSSSTMPRFGLRYGPLAHQLALVEFPVSGMARNPLTVLDSWNCFAAPDRHFSPRDYLEESRLLAEIYQRLAVGIINVYADPSHIHDRDEFFDAIDCLVDVATPTTYSDILDRFPGGA